MTLLAALRCKDGVVLTSDSRIIAGGDGQFLAHDGTKILHPRAGFLVAWAGWEDVAQAFTLKLERADTLSTELDRADIQDQLQALVQEVKAHGNEDMAEWLIAWWSIPEQKPVALHLFSDRPSVWIEEWDFAGDPGPRQIARVIATALRFVPLAHISIEGAKVLAYKVVRDAIHVGVATIGGGVQLGSVSQSGTEVATDDALKGIRDTLELWEDESAETLLRDKATPSETTTPETGLQI